MRKAMRWNILRIKRTGSRRLFLTRRRSKKEQQIVLNEPVEARYFRLHVTDVLKEESDLSLYYQNVSVQELEVYGQLEDCFVVETPVIEAGSRRTLELPTVPEPYSISFDGADYDVLVNMDGKITDTIADTQVELGFILEKDGEMQELPGIQTKIPASERVEVDREREEVPEALSAVTLPKGLHRDGVDAGERNRCN